VACDGQSVPAGVLKRNETLEPLVKHRGTEAKGSLGSCPLIASGVPMVVIVSPQLMLSNACC